MRIDITPLILTRDEEDNLPRVLSRLTWAREIVVIDSGSTDATLDIAARTPGVRVVSHPFESFAAQWTFALEHAGVTTDWVLALDADHVPDDAFVAGLEALPASPRACAFRATFAYCVQGKALRATLYPPRVVLFQRDRARFTQLGHKQVIHVDGPVESLPGRIRHDDRKPFSRWVESQRRYAEEEAELIRSSSWRELSWSGRARRLIVVAAPLAALIALVARGGILDGRAGLHYAMQRVVAECLIALALLERRLRDGRD